MGEQGKPDRAAAAPTLLEGGETAKGLVAGRYRLVRTLGSGAFGNVFLARDELLEREVCIKILRPEVGFKYDSAQLTQRFLREAQAAAKLRHPNVVSVYDVIEHHGQLAIVMEYIEGETVRDRLAREPKLTPAEVASIASQVAQGLDYAHDRGIVHRDVKPANIFLGHDGSVKIGDFGVALMHDKPKLTDGAAMVGTPAYMAPEEVEGLGADRRSDVFSLGCLMFEMLAGKVPFADPSVPAVLYQIVHKPAPSVAALNLEVPPAIDRVVRRALKKDPGRRYQRARDLAADLAGSLIEPPQRVPWAARMRRLRWAAAGIGIALCGALVYLAVSMLHGPRRFFLAVLPFESRAGGAEASFVARCFSSELARLLGEQREAVMVPAGNVLGQLSRGRELREAAREAGVEFIVSGRLVARGSAQVLDYSLLECKSGRKWNESIPVVSDDLQAGVGQVRTRVLDWLGVTTSARSTPLDAQSYELYLRGTSLIDELAVGRSEAFQQARGLLEKAFEIQPSPEVYSGLALLYFEVVNQGVIPSQENLGLARYYAEKGLALRPDFLPLLQTKVSVDIETGNVEEALRVAAAQLMADRFNPYFVSRIGWVLRHNGDDPAAKAFVGYACRLLPRDYLMDLNYVRCLFQGGEQEEAMARLRTLARDNPEKMWPRFDLAYYSELLGKTADAARYLEGVPDGLSPRLLRFQIDYTRGVATAFEPSDATRESASIDFDTSLMLAENYSLVGNTAQALDSFRQTLRLGWTAWSYFDWDPLLANLRRSEEYRQLRLRGLPEQQARRARERAVVLPVAAKLGIALAD